MRDHRDTLQHRQGTENITAGHFARFVESSLFFDYTFFVTQGDYFSKSFDGGSNGEWKNETGHK
jgi:hypothetical protein